MKKFTLLSALCGVLFLTPSISNATIPPCLKFTNNFDVGYCTAKNFFKVDDQLGANYKKIRSLVKPATEKNLKTLQQAWMTYRNDRCINSNTNEVDFECSYNLTNERAIFFDSQIKVCKSKGCNETEILSVTW